MEGIPGPCDWYYCYLPLRGAVPPGSILEGGGIFQSISLMNIYELLVSMYVTYLRSNPLLREWHSLYINTQKELQTGKEFSEDARDLGNYT